MNDVTTDVDNPDVEIEELAPEAEETSPESAQPQMVKIGDRELPYDEALQLAERGLKAGNAFRELGETKKSLQRWNELKELARQDPQKFLTSEEVGMSQEEMEEFIFSSIAKRLEKEALTPEQRELEELRNKDKQRSEEEARRKKEEEEQQDQAYRAEMAQKLNNSISEALQEVPDFKDMPTQEKASFIQAVGVTLRNHLLANKQITVPQAVQKVQASLSSGLDKYLTHLPVEQVMEKYPKLVEGIRKSLLKKHNAEPAPSTPRRQEPAKKRSLEDIQRETQAGMWKDYFGS